jgi:hypothetical protein
MLAVQKALTVLERKIDNKKVNEITASVCTFAQLLP